MTRDEIANQLGSLSRSVARLNIAHAAIETEIPLYSVGGLALAVASLGEAVTYNGLKVHAAAVELREGAHQAAGLVSPDIVRYVHTLITTGRTPGQEVGRWE